MLIKDEIIKDLELETGMDPRVIRLIVDHPLKFARQRMSDKEDWRSVMIRYFGKFIPKSTAEEDIQQL